ncbi:hypothetical protein OG689_19620 [Kitasatospora sp. NBC_00240]|uniref:hypothetical protein n=1 Tax=Kitasatospora sp. NBC_00240 TaxID=2903567 RepID=UPI0022518FDD|nr:hypothetical protein [Kitasatospora sp. NBC_00240]MCX5211471.1 hypothetical protein [Kitasatospora sp. NBC_00240]
MIIGAGVHDAEQATAAARRRKLKTPAAVTDAAAVLAAVQAVATGADPEQPPLPAKAGDVAQTIAEHAAALRLADHTRRTADRYQDQAADRYILAVRAAAPGWITALGKEFTALVTALREAAPKLPADTDTTRIDWTDPKVSAAWQQAEGAAVQLDQLVSDRDVISRVCGRDAARDNQLYAIAAVPQPTVDHVAADQWRRHIAPAIAQWRELRQQPVSRWVHLARQDALTLDLATTPAEVHQRAATAETWREATIAQISGGDPSRPITRLHAGR